ncbi:MAG: LD-carboxypeptidase [Clostridia bacterium]|nr:LD-carboxypeptidase [Clostridia bacterium]
MLVPKGLKKGDTIGVVSSSEPITEECAEDIEKSIRKLKDLGVNVKFGKYTKTNPTGYGETAKHKAEDINAMFADKNIDRNILCYAADIIVILFLII